MEDVINKNLLKGGEWIVKESDDIFIPEDRTEEQQMIYDMCRQFLQT